MSLKFAYWATNLGGLVTSTLPQKTDWSFEANKRYALEAEKVGFDYVLIATRFVAGYSAVNQLEALTLASALAPVTNKIKLIVAVLPGLWHPGVFAKAISTLDHISNGRAAINVVSGWFKDEYYAYGIPWLDHDERYRQSEEFIHILKDLWTKKTTTFKGDFYRINHAPLQPKPIQQPHPPIFQGGNSKAARKMAAKASDLYFMNGNTLEGLKKQIDEVRQLASEQGRTVKFGVNGFVIVRDSEEEAKQILREIIANADVQAVEGFRQQVKNAGKSTLEGIGMWANSNFEDLVQHNDGFKTGLIGTPDQVSDRIIELKKIGVDLVLTGFLHYDEELKQFGEKVIPLVREKESKLKLE